MTEEDRMLVFRKSISISREAQKFVEEAYYPKDNNITQEHLITAEQAKSKITLSRRIELAEEYGLTLDQLNDIEIEGASKHWPLH